MSVQKNCVIVHSRCLTSPRAQVCRIRGVADSSFFFMNILIPQSTVFTMYYSVVGRSVVPKIFEDISKAGVVDTSPVQGVVA